MIFLDQEQYVIDVDLDLPNQLDLEDKIIGNILGILIFTPSSPLIPEVLVSSQVILQIPLGNQFMTFEFIEG